MQRVLVLLLLHLVALKRMFVNGVYNVLEAGMCMLCVGEDAKLFNYIKCIDSKLVVMPLPTLNTMYPVGTAVSVSGCV